MAGGYLARTNKQYVFLSSLILTCVDLLYIYFILPESKPPRPSPNKSAASSNWSVLTMDYEFSWNPMDTVRILAMDPFLRKVGEVAFLYYTGLWAVISTLSLYAVKRFHLTPERLGELMSALGLCTMVAEAVLVRILVPMLGEKRAMLLGLVCFGLQCVVLGFAYEGWHLFVLCAFSMLSNLVYPSLTSLVSGSVAPDSVGEALGAVNGIKALTEGVGPLVFGSLMTLSENTALPGRFSKDHGSALKGGCILSFSFLTSAAFPFFRIAVSIGRCTHHGSL
jgi:MFS transporter, DHA1 family, tetracycline resistance protein